LYLTSNIHFYTYSTIIGNIYAYKLVIKRLYAKIREIGANILLEKSSTTKRFEAQEILFHPSLFSSPINPDTSGSREREEGFLPQSAISRSKIAKMQAGCSLPIYRRFKCAQ